MTQLTPWERAVLAGFFLWQEKETPGQAWPGAKEEDHAPAAPAYLISTP